MYIIIDIWAPIDLRAASRNLYVYVGRYRHIGTYQLAVRNLNLIFLCILLQAYGRLSTCCVQVEFGIFI